MTNCDFDARLAHYLRSIGRETCSEADVHEFALVSIKNAAALSFYMFTNPYVLMKGTTADKYEAVAKNVRAPLKELQ